MTFVRLAPFLCLAFLASACERGASPSKKTKDGVTKAGASALASSQAAPGVQSQGTPQGDASGDRVVADPTGAPADGTGTSQGTSVEVREIGGSELLAQIRSSGAKGTLVNAWASWCGPCRREFPMLVGLKPNLDPQGIEVIFVSVDEPESRGAAIGFFRDHGGELPVLVAERPLGPFKQALNPRWPGMLPATFLFDAEGKLVYFWGGPVYEQELLPVLEKYSAGTLEPGEATFGLAPGKDSRGP